MSRFWHAVTLVGYFGLFALLLLWFAWLEPSKRVPVSLVLVLLVGPLLLPLRGLLYGRPYTCAWSSFLALFYFSAGVFSAAGPMRRPWLAWLEIGFSLLLFWGAVFYVRARRVRKADTSRSEAAVTLQGTDRD
ncbi:MAG: DUF2069 domain-containing protein [Candidatus Competibacteraceae bacterium]|nr:DUF2069 domain-containing protein [Candidatus Competibacteraceae bacterium]MBK7984084.1 DUF2069 domain-containing protein [Candidatus Competibacteraceae bacterium]MBK8963524.1 DUF2069 domain-containing protein [Candidatus Competibacteraceae bacterium]MBK9950418.1 DUF2069 domain-containing protein [Candidatus Competibacteraceae bacterium]